MLDPHNIYDDPDTLIGGDEYDLYSEEEEFTAYTAAVFDDPIEGGNNENTPNDSGEHAVLSYNPYEFISKCCKAFLFYDKLSIYCSKCGREVDKIQPGQSISIGVKFNSTTEETSISGDILRAFHNSIPRFATDPTCELCERKCKKCSTKMRYLRDRKGDMWYVCSNKDCRHVDMPSDLVISDT
jgi:hypothetical protein